MAAVGPRGQERRSSSRRTASPSGHFR